MLQPGFGQVFWTLLPIITARSSFWAVIVLFFSTQKRSRNMKDKDLGFKRPYASSLLSGWCLKPKGLLRIAPLALPAIWHPERRLQVKPQIDGLVDRCFSEIPIGGEPVNRWTFGSLKNSRVYTLSGKRSHSCSWNDIPMFNRKYLDSIRGLHFPASYLNFQGCMYLFQIFCVVGIFHLEIHGDGWQHNHQPSRFKGKGRFESFRKSI